MTLHLEDALLQTPEWTAMARKVMVDLEHMMRVNRHLEELQAGSKPLMPAKIQEAANTVSRVLIFNALAKHLSLETRDQIRELEVTTDPLMMDTLLIVHRKRDNGIALLRFPVTQIREWRTDVELQI